MSYKVKLPAFEGPFDLLVYLIENAQMSIYDIQVSEITSQYLTYLNTMRAMDVNIATEFMVLAASLIEIKSKMILPRTTIEGEIILEEDPRSELVERLLEYKKYKAGAEALKEKEEFMTSVFEKPQEDISVYLEQPDEYLSLDIEHFAGAFELFLHRKKKVEDVRRHYTRIEREKASIENRMVFIKDTFKSAFNKGVKMLNLKALIPNKKDKYDVVVTFVSVLQMMRDKFLDADQKSLYGEIIVKPGSKDMDEPFLENEGVKTDEQ